MKAYLPIYQSWSIFYAILVIQIKEWSSIKGTDYITASETKLDSSHNFHKSSPKRVKQAWL